MRRFFAGFIFLRMAGILFSQQLDFFREEITFELDSVYFTVNGDYYFRNSSDQLLTPRVTFPVSGKNTERPFDTLLVFAQENMIRSLPVVVQDTVARFTVILPPHSERMFRVIYRQRHTGFTATYILTTTSFWKKALEYAGYKLVVPGYLEITGFSIHPDTVTEFTDHRIYSWTKKDFLPQVDFSVNFLIGH